MHLISGDLPIVLAACARCLQVFFGPPSRPVFEPEIPRLATTTVARRVDLGMVRNTYVWHQLLRAIGRERRTHDGCSVAPISNVYPVQPRLMHAVMRALTHSTLRYLRCITQALSMQRLRVPLRDDARSITRSARRRTLAIAVSHNTNMCCTRNNNAYDTETISMCRTSISSEQRTLVRT